MCSGKTHASSAALTSAGKSNQDKLEVARLVQLLAYVALQNDTLLPKCPRKTTPFHSRSGRTSLADLITRLVAHVRCSPACFATALVYMDRISAGCPDLSLCTDTVELLFTTSLLIANQFLDDVPERAVQFAHLAGVSPRMMAALKTDLLFRLRFRLVVSEEEVMPYASRLEGRMASSHSFGPAMWAPTMPSAIEIAPLPIVMGKSRFTEFKDSVAVLAHRASF